MPFLAPVAAWVAANATLLEGLAAVASVGATGVGLYEQNQAQKAQAAYMQQQMQQQQQATAGTTTQQAQSQRAQQQAAIARQFPNLQEQLGGSAAPDYLIHESATMAGYPGEANIGADAFQQFLGDRNLTGTAASNLSPTTTSPTLATGGAAAFAGGSTTAPSTFWSRYATEPSTDVSGGLV
jgi:hypothetical protein